jgi:hypothetical protein
VQLNLDRLLLTYVTFLPSKQQSSLTSKKNLSTVINKQPGNAPLTIMEEKQKVTLYLTSDLYRQLKIKAAVELETMSTIAARALEIYIQHPELIEEAANARLGKHQVYNCPECHHPAVIRDGEMIAIGSQPGILEDELAVNLSPQVDSLLVGQR